MKLAKQAFAKSEIFQYWKIAEKEKISADKLPFFSTRVNGLVPEKTSLNSDILSVLSDLYLVHFSCFSDNSCLKSYSIMILKNYEKLKYDREIN